MSFRCKRGSRRMVWSVSDVDRMNRAAASGGASGLQSCSLEVEHLNDSCMKFSKHNSYHRIQNQLNTPHC